MTDLVVDSSVAFKWLIPDSAEDDVPAAKSLLVEHMEARVRITVPSLLYHEVGNILRFARARPAIVESEQALADLFAIPLTIVEPAAPDAADALRLAVRHDLTYYVGLAEALDCALVTADRRLARHFAGSPLVRLLGAR